MYRYFIEIGEREREERIIRFEFHKIEEHILSSIV